MNKLINNLLNAKIIDVNTVEDYIQLTLDNAKINIYVPFKIYKDNILIDSPIKKLISSQITNIEYKEEEYLIFEMEDKYKLKISIFIKDYTIPEAINIFYNTGEIVVI